MAKEINLDAFADKIANKLLAAKQQANEAGEDVGEEFIAGVVEGIQKHSKEAKSEIAKMYEDFIRQTNNFTKRKGGKITDLEWSRTLSLSKELLKSERYADAVREKLNGISVTFKNIGKVSGLDKIIAELDKAENKLETVTWSEAGKNYRKKKTTASKPKTEAPVVSADPAPVVKAEAEKQEAIKKTTREMERQAKTAKEIAHTQAVKSRYLGNTLKGKSDFQRAIGGELSRGNKAVAAKLFSQYQSRFPDGKFNPFETYKSETDWIENYSKYLEQADRHLAEIDSRLIDVEQDTVRTQNRYKSFVDLLTEGKEKALSGIDIDTGKFSVNVNKDLDGAEKQLKVLRKKLKSLEPEALAAKEAYEPIINERSKYFANNLKKSELQDAIKSEWSLGNKQVAAKLYEQYKTKFPDGKFDPSKLKMFGEDWTNNYTRYVEQANRHIVELDTILDGVAEQYGKYRAYENLSHAIGSNQIILDNAKKNKLANDVVQQDLNSRRQAARDKYVTDDAAVAQENLNKALEEFNRRQVIAKDLLDRRNQMTKAIEDDDDLDNNPLFAGYEFPVEAIMEASRKFAEANLDSQRFAVTDLKEAVKIAKELGVEVNDAALRLDEMENEVLSDMLTRQKKFAMDNDKAGTPEKSNQIFDADKIKEQTDALREQKDVIKQVDETQDKAEDVGQDESVVENNQRKIKSYQDLLEVLKEYFSLTEKTAKSKLDGSFIDEFEKVMPDYSLDDLDNPEKKLSEIMASFKKTYKFLGELKKAKKDGEDYIYDNSIRISSDHFDDEIDYATTKLAAMARVYMDIGGSFGDFNKSQQKIVTPKLVRYDKDSEAFKVEGVELDKINAPIEAAKNNIRELLESMLPVLNDTEKLTQIVTGNGPFGELTTILSRLNANANIFDMMEPERAAKELARIFGIEIPQAIEKAEAAQDGLAASSTKSLQDFMSKWKELSSKSGDKEAFGIRHASLLEGVSGESPSIDYETAYNQLIANEEKYQQEVLETKRINAERSKQLQEFVEASKALLSGQLTLDEQQVFTELLNKISLEGLSAVDALGQLKNAIRNADAAADMSAEGLSQISSEQESVNNKFKEYNDLVSVGYDRIQKLQQIRENGYSGAGGSTDVLLRANHSVWDKVKENDFFKDTDLIGGQRLAKIEDIAKAVVSQALTNANLTEDQVVAQLQNIRSASGGNFKPNGSDAGWNHFATYDDSGNAHKMQKENGITYKVYAAFENIEDLNADIISSIMTALTDAGFKGRLKTTSGSESLGDRVGSITSTDQLVIHGASRKDQEIAYNILRNMKTPLSYLGGGIDTPDGSFTQTLASNNIEKYVRLQSDLIEQSKKTSQEINQNVLDNFGAESENLETTVSQLQKLSSIDVTRIFDNVDLKAFLESFNIDKSHFATFRTLFEELMQITKAMADGVNVGNAFDLKMEEITNTIMSLGGHMMDINDDGYSTMLQDFYKHMSNTKIQFNDTIKADYTKDQWKSLYGTYKNRLTADLTKGVAADSLYQELSGLFPSLFPEGVLAQQDQFKLIIEKLDEARQLQANNWKTLYGFTSSDRDGIQSGVDDMFTKMSDALWAESSSQQLDGEADSFRDVEQSATKAAKAKGEFTKKNKQLGEVAADSSENADDEAESLDNVRRAASEMPDMSAYDSVSIRRDENNRPYMVSGTSTIEGDHGRHIRTTDTFQLNDDTGRWEFMGSTEATASTREMVQALEEYYKVQNRIQKLRLDTSNNIHESSIEKLETEDLVRAEERLLALGVQVNNIENQVNLSVSQRQALLDVELRARQEMYDVIAKMEDKQATTAVKPYQKMVADEIKKSSKIDSDIRLLGENGASARLQEQVASYRQLVDELVNLRVQLAQDPELANNEEFANRFTDTANRAKNASDAIAGIFKESQKLSKIGALRVVDNKDVSKVENLKAAMIEFVSTTCGADAKVTGFDEKTKRLSVTLDRGAGVVENITVALDKATGHLNAFSVGTDRATNEWEDFKKQAAAGAKQLVGMYVGLQEGVQAARKGVEYVKEIDLAMTELKKVTDETDASYKEFLEDISDIGSVVGATITDLTNMASEWARLGYSMEEAGRLAESTAVLMNVSEFDSVEDATSALVSSLQAFATDGKDAAQRAKEIVDVLNNIGNKYPVATNELAEGLAKSGAALIAANNTIEEQVALLSAGNATMQDVSTVAAGLKIVAARLRGTTSDIDDEADSAITNVSKLQEKIKSLTAAANGGKGIDIINEDGSYKSTYEILYEISKIFDKMDDLSSASLLELIAGKNRSSVIAAVIQNGDILEDAYADALKSEGSAQKELDTYLDSIQGRIDLFNRSLQEFWGNLISSDAVKWTVDRGTDIMDILDTNHGKVIALLAAFKLMAKFKGYDIGGIFRGLQQSLAQLNATKFKLDILPDITGATADMRTYAAAVSGLTPKLQAQALATKGATTEQIRSALAMNEVDQATIKAVTSNLRYNEGKQASIVLDQTHMANLIAANRTKLSDAAATFLQEHANQELNEEMLEQAVLSGQLTRQEAAQILSALGLTGANHGLAASFKAVGTAISFAFKSNPIGFLLTLGTTILSLIPIFKTFGKSAEESAQEVKQAAQEATQAYTEAKNEIESNLKSITESSDSDLYETLIDEFAVLVQGVNSLGENVSLTADQYERYRSICEDIVSISPALARGHDSATAAIGQNVDALRELIDLEKEQQRQNALDYTTGEKWDNLVDDSINQYKESLDKRNSVLQTFDHSAGELFKNSAGEEIKYYTGSLMSALSDWADTGVVFNRDDDEGLAAFKDLLNSLKYTNQIDQILSDYTYTNDGGVEMIGVGQWILDNIEFLQDNVHLLEGEFAEAVSEYEVATRGLESAQRAMVDTLTEVPMSMKQYGELSDSNQSFIDQWIQNSGMFEIGEDTTADTILKWKQAIKSMVAALSDGTYTYVLGDGTAVSANDIIDSIVSLDPSKVDWSSYQEQMNTLIEYLWQAIGGENNTLGFTDKNALALTFGFDIQLTDGNENRMIERYVQLKGVSEDQAREYFASLPAAVVQRLLKIEWDLVDEDNIDDTIDKAMGSMTSSGLSSKTYTVLVESIEAYNDILTQTSEVAADNTEVTQEYKDSLIDLGISQEDLNKCFDDANPLIVKNAKALNKLVKEASKNVATNVKLAKSNARLDYYKLVKQLNATLDGTTKLDTATRESISTIFDQIDAIETALYKYQLLEDALLGVHNAFNEFNDAKEIDSLNTYGDSYVEMVQTLYDGLYKTGQVGTEQFKAAAEALIPYDVYQGLVDENERMEAMLEYFNKNIAPTLTLDEDEFKFDYDGIENFVEKAREAKVLIGEDNESFDLAENMNLEEAARLMGITTTQAYAFFAELDKYNTGSEQSFLAQLDDSLEGKISNITTELQDLNKQKLVFLEDKTEIAEELEKLGAGGTVDLTIRPVINSQELIDAGWDTQAGQIATVFTSTFSNKLGNVAINFTPIVTDALGNRIDVLSPAELQKYAEDVIAGVREDDLRLQIGAKFEGEDAIAQAEAAAEHIHNLHEDYVGLDKTIGDINADIASNNAELQKTGKSAYEMWQAYTKNEAAIAALELVSDKQRLLTSDEANMIGMKWDEAKGLNVQQALDNLLGKKLKLEEPTVLTAQLSIEYINTQIAELESKINKIKHDASISPEVKQAKTDELDEQIRKLKEDKVVLATTFGIELTDEEKEDLLEYLNDIEEITIGDKTFKVTAKGISETMAALRKLRDYALGNIEVKANAGGSGGGGKKVTYTYLAEADGTAHARGTAYKNGSCGAPKTETALMGELGPELLVRNGKWTTVGDNGAEFTQVKKGDIIFNHKQTEDLLSKGYVTGRGRLQGGAFASGTAYAGLWKPLSPDKELSNKAGRDFSYAASGLNNAADSLSDASDEFKEVFDWIAVRLEEINEDIDYKNAQLDNAIGYAAQNNIVDKIIQLNQKLHDNLISGSQEYYAYAEQLLSKIPEKYRDAAKDGTIAIEKFAGDAGEKTLEAIQDYRDWVQKGADAAQQAEEAFTEISSLAKQAIENIATQFENEASFRENQASQLDAYNAFLEAMYGAESENIYNKLLEINKQNIDELGKQKDKMQQELNAQVKEGNIKKYSQDWYDAINDIAALDTEIVELRTDLMDLQDSINEIHWEHFDLLISQFESVSEEAENLIDILATEDVVDEMGNWTDNGITSLGLYAQKMDIAQKQAEQYAKEIDDLNRDWKKLGYTEKEYLDKLDELKSGQYGCIKLYSDTKDAIVDLNKERVDAIKKSIEKETEAYEKLIKIKQDELNTEKD